MKKISLYFLLFFAHGVSAQILDDSTKLVYGPTTTRFIYEDNIKFNDLFYVEIDTSLFNIHRYTTTELSDYSRQDLGVIGTASRNIYYTPPTIIGARPGFYAYEDYFVPPEDFRYYDTKSPYSRIGASVGGNGRSRVDVGFNRSDSSNFNIGIDYKRIISDKQTASIGRHDRLTDSEGYDIYMLYFTPNKKYLALTNFSRNKNTIIDQGGIDTTGGFSFFEEEAGAFLTDAKSEYFKKNFHFFHQFNLDSVFQLYQVYDNSTASSKFRIENLSEDKDYFSNFNISIDSTSEDNSFASQTLETGIKGTLGKLFYLAYYKIRSYDFVYGNGKLDTLNFQTLKPETAGVEHYIGGAARIQLNRKYKLAGSLDFNFNGNQRLTGNLLAKNFDVNLTVQQHAASYMEKAFLGNHDFWVNDFKNIKTLQVEGGYGQKIGNSFIRPKASFTSITDYVYYDTLAAPQQIDGTNTIIQSGLDFSFVFFKHFYFTGNAAYNLVSGKTTEALPIPEFMINLNVFYHKLLFQGNLDLQVGLDSHWKSGYYAPDYHVSTNQFFMQNKFIVPSYLITDAYLNIKLGHAYVFVKMNNLLQTFTQEGYFVAPNYVGKRSLLDFGFYWMFFD